MWIPIILFLSICGCALSINEEILWNAAREGDLPSVTEYLASGTNPDWRNTAHYGQTAALHQAAGNNHAAVLEALLESGADADMQDRDGGTPLHWAVMRGSTAAVEILIRYGADVDAKESIGELTPLMVAIMYGQSSSAEEMINSQANLDQQDTNGRTALHCAVDMNNPGMTQLLLQNGANTRILTVNGMTPGDTARDKGFIHLANTIESFTGATTNTIEQPINNRAEL